MTRFVLMGPPLFLLACGPGEQEVQRRMAECEPVRSAIRELWRRDGRAPCGERWLMEHAPAVGASPSPWGRSREALGSWMVGDFRPELSLDLRPESVPSEIWTAQLELLSELDIPPGVSDPWLTGRIGLAREDASSTALLVAWSAWDPDEARRADVARSVAQVFDRDLECDSPECWVELADRLGGDAGLPGDRSCTHDALWREKHSPRVVGVAGAWVASWRDWWDGETARYPGRPGLGVEPAAALWIGGTESALEALDDALRQKAPPDRPSRLGDRPGARAAGVIPWGVSGG